MKPLFFFSALALLTFCWSSCNHPAQDPKSQFVHTLKDSTASAFYYATEETADFKVQTLTSPQASGIIDVLKISLPMTLRYTGVMEGKDHTEVNYKAEIVKKDAGIALVISEMGGKPIWEQVLSDRVPVPDTLHVPQAGYDSLAACIADWNCMHRGELECLANKTCQNQYGALTCCLTNGQCFSVHMVFPPTSWRCRLKDLMPNLDGLVMSR